MPRHTVQQVKDATIWQFIFCHVSAEIIYLNDVNIILVAEGLEQDSLYVKGCISLATLWHYAEEGALGVHLQQFDGWQKSTCEPLLGLGLSQHGHHRFGYWFPIQNARETPVTGLHGTQLHTTHTSSTALNKHKCPPLSQQTGSTR